MKQGKPNQDSQNAIRGCSTAASMRQTVFIWLPLFHILSLYTRFRVNGTAVIHFNYKKSFANFELDCDFSMPGSGVTILFGPSGGGKSTLLNCIAGLEKSESAYAKVNDVVFDDKENNIHLPAHQRKVGYVFQDSRLFPHMTVLDNLLYGFK